MSELVLTETDDGVATITLNRPEARNALSAALLDALVAALVAADRDDDVGAIVLTGSDPAFCAGLDLRGSARRAARSSWPPWPSLAGIGHPDDRGRQRGGHHRWAGAGPQLRLPSGQRAGPVRRHPRRLGILPGWGLSVLLPQAIGLRRAVEMSLTGNFVEADEALRLGLVNHVVPHDELLGVARQLAAESSGTTGPPPAPCSPPTGVSRAPRLDEGLALEAEAARDWRDRTFDAAEVEQRRSAIMAGGRQQ